MSKHASEDGFQCLDRKVGTAWSRFWGWSFMVAAIATFMAALNDENFSLSGHWPMLALAALLGGAARLCFRSKEGMLDILSDTARTK